MFFKFKENDIFRQTIVTYPTNNFMFLYDDDGEFKVLLNNPLTSGSAASIRTDSFNLTEVNVDRTGSQVIYPFMDKLSSQDWISHVSTASFHSTLWGGKITGTYLGHNTITRDYIANTQNWLYKSLKNVWNSYSKLNADFNFENFPTSSSVLLIPRQYCQSAIKKGSVIATIFSNRSGAGLSNTVSIHKAQDIYKDGILRVIEDGMPSSHAYSTIGNKVGFVLYDHGVVLFQSASIHGYDAVSNEAFLKTSAQNFEWSSGSDNVYNWKWFSDKFFCNKEENLAFCSLQFQGINKIENITLMCHAKNGQLNTSMNPTFLERQSNIFLTQTSQSTFTENSNMQIKNTISSSHNILEDFEKQVYISKIYVYDENKELLGVAKLANPVVKKESNDYTFKLGFDL